MTGAALATTYLALVTLGYLVFMRDKKGALRPIGWAATIFFGVGTVLSLYLLIFGA